jgi:hypothetical protein
VYREGNAIFFIPSDAFMTYFMKKFPNLEAIVLENDEGEFFSDDIFEGVGTQPIAAIIQFFICLLKIPYWC